jgi:hypothetical protein
MDESRDAVMLESRDAVMGRLRREALVGREAKVVVERKKGRGKKAEGGRRKGSCVQKHFFKGACAVARALLSGRCSWALGAGRHCDWACG